MSDEFPDVGNLFGMDYSDPLGVEEYLRKKKEEEDRQKAEEARIAKEQESHRTFMGDLLGAGENLLTSTFDPHVGVLGRPVSGALRSGIDIARQAIGILPWNEGINSPEINEALDKTLGGGFAQKMMNEPVSQMMEREFGPEGKANQLPPAALLRSALFPDPLAGDIGRTTSKTIMGPQGPITTTHETTPEDVKEQISTAHQIGGAGEKIAELGLNPEMYTIPAMPGMVAAGLFGPGMVKSAYENVEQGEYGKAAIDALMAGALGLHGGREILGRKGEPISSESRQSEQVREPSPELQAPRKPPVEGMEDIVDLVRTPEEKSAIGGTKAALNTFLDTIKEHAADTLNNEDIRNMKVSTDPNVKTAYYNQENNTIYINPSKLLDEHPAELIDTVLHEISHGNNVRHQFGQKALTGEMVLGPRHPVAEIVGRDELTAPPREADLEINAGELGLTPEELANIKETNTVEYDPELTEHYTITQEPRSHFLPGEHTFQGNYEALKNHPGIIEAAGNFESELRGIQDAGRREAGLHARPQSYEENLAEIRNAPIPENPFEGIGDEHLGRMLEDIKTKAENDPMYSKLVEDIQAEQTKRLQSSTEGELGLSAPREVQAPRKSAGLTKAEQIEHDTLSRYVFEQNLLMREYGEGFQKAADQKGKTWYSKAFAEAKANRDRVQSRINQLESAGATKIARAKVPNAIDVEAKVVSEPVKEIGEGKTQVVDNAPTPGEGGKKVGDTYTDTEGNRWMVQDISGENVVLRKGKPGGGTTDKVISRAELEGKTRPNVDQLIEQAKRESAERKVEPAKNQAEVDREHERMLSEKVEETPKNEVVVSAPAHDLRRLLEATGLTRFNIDTLEKTLRAKGLDVPEGFTEQLRPLVDELKARGWVNEKLGGTYTLLTAPPKAKVSGKLRDITNLGEQLEKSVEEPSKEVQAPEKPPSGEEEIDLSGLDKAIEGTEPSKTPNMEQTMKEKLTPDEIQAIAKLFGGETKRKGTKETPQEVLDAQKAALRGLVEKETEGGKNIPEDIGETGEGESPRKPFEVTLSDGSTHIVRADTPENAQAKAEQVLQENGSSKTVDKVEPHLGSLEKAAKYEIEPEKAGREQASEEVKDIKAEQRREGQQLSEQVRETGRLEREQFREKKQRESEDVKEAKRLGKEEEKLRAAQNKEKFEEKPYTVNLSNGRIVTIRARNEKIAREVVESRIRAKGSGVTIQGVAEKPSALDEAITGAARKTEETGFLQHPAVKLLNAIKSIAFGGDVGHLLRQGKQMNADLLFSKHAGKVLKQIPELFKLAKGEKYLDELNDRLYSDPDIKGLVDNFGLDMPGMGKGLKEEAFHGAGFAEELPVVGRFYVKPSERAYTGGLNYLRAATAKKWVESLKKDGFTPDNAPEKYHALARAINIISQRGQFQPAYQKLFSDASAVLGAPRAKAARLQNAVELFKGGTSANIVRTTAAKTLAFNLGLFGLLKATTGATFVADPESSDFGKIRISPKITVDPWMGLGVTARTVSKLIEGRQKSPYKKAHTYPARAAEYPVKPSDAIMQEFLGGVAPGIRLAWEAMKGTDLRGYQVPRIQSLLEIAPLPARGVAGLLQEGDIDEALILSLLQFGGEGVDTFNYEKAKKQQEELLRERGLGGNRRPSLNF